jgi:hypothetical protein
MSQCGQETLLAWLVCWPITTHGACSIDARPLTTHHELLALASLLAITSCPASPQFWKCHHRGELRDNWGPGDGDNALWSTHRLCSGGSPATMVAIESRQDCLTGRLQRSSCFRPRMCKTRKAQVQSSHVAEHRPAAATYRCRLSKSTLPCDCVRRRYLVIGEETC